MTTNDRAAAKAAAPAKSPEKSLEKNTNAAPAAAPQQARAASVQPAPQSPVPVKPASSKSAPKRPVTAKPAARKSVAAPKPAAAPRARSHDEHPAFGAGAADAYWRSAAVAAKGAEAFHRELASCSQRAIERNVAAVTALSGVTSLAELWELQAGFGRAAVDSLLAESARLTEISISTAGEVFAPFPAR